MRNFVIENKIQQAALMFISHQLPYTSNGAFCYFDKDSDGRISTQDLAQVLAENSNDLQCICKEEAKKIMKKCDLNHNGFLDFSEFLLCTGELRNILSP